MSPLLGQARPRTGRKSLILCRLAVSGRRLTVGTRQLAAGTKALTVGARRLTVPPTGLTTAPRPLTAGTRRLTKPPKRLPEAPSGLTGPPRRLTAGASELTGDAEEEEETGRAGEEGTRKPECLWLEPSVLSVCSVGHAFWMADGARSPLSLGDRAAGGAHRRNGTHGNRSVFGLSLPCFQCVP